MYEFADAIMKYLNSRYIELFGRMKNLLSIDELNILGKAENLYSELMKLTLPLLLEIASNAYGNVIDGGVLTEEWLTLILQEYDPVTKYVFENEVERKEARFAEALIASKGDYNEVDVSLRYWSQTVGQCAININDRATLQAYIDSGVEFVRWVTEKDGRQCAVCDERDGKVYPIKELPPKPHIGCRCRFIAEE